MKPRILVPTLLAVAALGVTAMVLAGSGHAGGRGGMPPRGGPLGPLGHALGQLDLTADQTKSIDALVEAQAPAIEALVEKQRLLRNAFHEAHPPTEVDEAAIRAHVMEVATIGADVAVLRARLAASVAKVLTTEQLGQLETTRNRMISDRKFRPAPPMDRPMPPEH
jgi:Spy/CpxP family protein refolding chaperone